MTTPTAPSTNSPTATDIPMDFVSRPPPDTTEVDPQVLQLALQHLHQTGAYDRLLESLKNQLHETEWQAGVMQHLHAHIEKQHAGEPSMIKSVKVSKLLPVAEQYGSDNVPQPVRSDMMKQIKATFVKLQQQQKPNGSNNTG